MWDQTVQNPSLFLDIADEGLETKSYEILSAVGHQLKVDLQADFGRR